MFKVTYRYEKLNICGIGKTVNEAHRIARKAIYNIMGYYFSPIFIKHARKTLVYQGGIRGVIGKLA